MAPVRTGYSQKDLFGEYGTAKLSFADLLPRFHNIMDDGHTIKLVRAMSICQDICTKYENVPWRKVQSQDMWLKLHYMVLDATEHLKNGSERWIRSAGFDELWDVSQSFLHFQSPLVR